MFRKVIIPGLLVAALAAAPVTQASAHEHHDGLALGLLGAAVLGTTAAILSSQSEPAQPVYVQPAPVYVQPAPVYAYEPPVVYAAPPPVVYATPYPGYYYGGGYYRHSWR